MFRLVIFDLDGTLADTKEGIAETFNVVLEKANPDFMADTAKEIITIAGCETDNQPFG